MTNSIKPYYRMLAYCGSAFVLVMILFATCCTVVDSGEVGIVSTSGRSTSKTTVE